MSEVCYSKDEMFIAMLCELGAGPGGGDLTKDHAMRLRPLSSPTILNNAVTHSRGPSGGFFFPLFPLPKLPVHKRFFHVTDRKNGQYGILKQTQHPFHFFLGRVYIRQTDTKRPADAGRAEKRRQKDMYRSNKEQTPGSRVYEAAIIFARMWGVMETLEPLPNLGNEKVRDLAVGMAEEFVGSGLTDHAGFFAARVGEMKSVFEK